MEIGDVPTVILYDPAISSFNMGDHIISAAVHQHLAPVLQGAFVVGVSSHLPASRYLNYAGSNVKHRFVGGSNLLRGKMNARFRQWDLTPRYSRAVGPAVLMGVGWWQYGDEPNGYTKWLYNRVLSRDLVHSVRDEMTAEYLRRMGFENVLNTSCPTMWSLDEEHCESIPHVSGDAVVATVTDYNRDPIRDREMLKVLGQHYRSVKVWIQGNADAAYLRTLDLGEESIELIPPNLASFDAALSDASVDYVGTRLHAGIRALQLGRRSLIVGVDNRAAEKHRDFGIPFIARERMADLDCRLRSGWKTRVRIPVDRILQWKGQFPELASSGQSRSR